MPTDPPRARLKIVTESLDLAAEGPFNDVHRVLLWVLAECQGEPNRVEFVAVPGTAARQRAVVEGGEDDVGVLPEECSQCGVHRENCRPGGQWYSVCPFALGGPHRWVPRRSNSGGAP